jgi:hypothetical protein
MPAKLALSAMVFAGALFAATAAFASDHLSKTAFDGEYFGQRKRLDPLSGELCANFTLHSLTIKNGRMRGDGGDINGVVAANGFFSGTFKVFDLEQPFEGRIENDALLGGVVSPDGACFWLVRMIRLDKSN